MGYLSFSVFSLTLLASQSVLAAEGIMTPAASMTRMMVGLGIVLLVLAVIAWAMKKFMRGTHGSQSTIKVVDGVSVGTRERVMVLEVADRWLVVGVAGGQITSLANMAANPEGKNEKVLSDSATDISADKQDGKSFSEILSKSASNLIKK